MTSTFEKLPAKMQLTKPLTNQHEVLKTVKGFLRRQERGKNRVPMLEDDLLSESCASIGALSPLTSKKVKPLDKTRLGALMSVRHGLERNIQG